MTEQTEYDVVIIGAGIAGSILAKKLGEANKSVLLLESGVKTEQGASRNTYLNKFYNEVAKVPEAPYPDEPSAPNALTLQIDNYEKVNKTLSLKQGTKSYLDQEGSPLPFSSTYERLSGGTMWHWLGTSLRMLPNDFTLQTTYGRGVDWPISYDDLQPYYSQAENLIGVSANKVDQEYLGITFDEDYDYPMEALPSTITDQVISKGLAAYQLKYPDTTPQLTVTNTPAGRNSIRRYRKYNNGRRMCAGNTSCVPICPIQAKYDPTITLAEALETGQVTMLSQTVASNIQLDMTTGLISGVDYIHWKNDGPNESGTATGKLYVLSAHAIEGPRLLLNSNKQLPDGVANSSGEVGCNLMDHPVMNAWAVMPEPVYPFRGPVSTSGIESLRDGDFRTDHSAYRIEIHNIGWNWPTNAPYSDMTELVDNQRLFGVELRKALNHKVTHQVDLNFLVEQLPQKTNRVTLSTQYKDALGIPTPKIHYNLDSYDRAGFASAYKTALDIFNRLGAQSKTDFNAQMHSMPNYFEYQDKSFLFQGAGHIAGTTRMGSCKEDSVVDSNLRSWDHPNLFMMGSGVFPTLATSNPTLTIAALTIRAAENIIKTLDAS
ncbi:MAG: choline dehydrogenase-like flavoprotein [Phenylobacterium sp.]|jgi:choline dehydrogenase-like flavoprotein